MHNCERSLPKSVGYALRSWVARVTGFFRRNVTIYMAVTEFQKNRMVADGFPAERIAVVPNMGEITDDTGFRTENRSYVGFAGRVSPEKGVSPAGGGGRRNPKIPFRAAGDPSACRNLLRRLPKTSRFSDRYARRDGRIDRGSRFMVLCSTWFEGFPMVLVEAMLRGTPAIAARIGGIPEIVDDGVTGLLFEPGDAGDLANKVRSLWEDPVAVRKWDARHGRKRPNSTRRTAIIGG